jgi:hypothetical protein
MRRQPRPFARPKVPASSRLGAAPDTEPRRLPWGIALLAAVVLLLAFAPSASASVQFLITPPETTIDSGPSGPTNDASPSFSFSSSEPGSSFECRLDSTEEDDFQPCSSPKSYSSLADGTHTFEVRATDPANNTDPTPDSRTFTVDTAPPDTTITGGPIGATNDPTPTFAFSSEPGASFECKVDSGSYSACSSPKTTQHLADGSHTFYVRATDPVGNVDPTPASQFFTVATASVSVSGTNLIVAAVPGATDNLVIRRPSLTVLQVSDLPRSDLPSGPYAGSGVHAGPGCTRSGDYQANCTGGLSHIQVTANDQNDRVINKTAVQSALFGGYGIDDLVGGSGVDVVIGGFGRDSMTGGPGNDQVVARDGVSDTKINCDGGIGATGTRDKAGLDLLPKDPNSIVTGCETKTRY